MFTIALILIVLCSGVRAEFTVENSVADQTQTVPLTHDHLKILNPMIIIGHPAQTHGYYRSNANTATLTDTPLMEIPASISVVLQDLTELEVSGGLRPFS